MERIKKKIIEILSKKPYITKEKLELAFRLQKTKDIPLRRILIEEKMFTEEELSSLLSKSLFLPSLEFIETKFNPAVIKLIPEQIARKYCVVPVFIKENNLTIAMDDPLNIFILDNISTISEYEIDIVLSPTKTLSGLIDACYSVEIQSAEAKESLEDKSHDKEIEVTIQPTMDITDVIKESEKPPIIKLVDLIIAEALKRRASDIHVEPGQYGLRVRYRIDGSLYDMFKLPKANQNAILTRIKIISELDITETRFPQDGRFKVRLEGREVDFRVSALPTGFGQKFVLRSLDKSNLPMGLENLGFSQEVSEIFNEAVSRPFGMILITGPTGSGKSTTLYSILNKLNVLERHIVTVEDPVEYQIEGITQIQIKPEIGLNFATGLRSILRHTPDIIMIGEIRDYETADIAVKASLTGQLVLSTLHTNDAISSIARLIDIGVEPFLVASGVIMVCAQRLVRCTCPKCKEPTEILQKLLEEVGFKDNPTFYQGKGCRYCNNTGFYGRMAISEALIINDVIQTMIFEKKSTDEIKEYAVKYCGMRTLRDDAFKKVSEGIITLEEAIRITTQE